MRRGLLILLCVGLVGLGGATLFVRGRLARCAAVPLLAADRLPPIDFTQLRPSDRTGVALPDGWNAPALGVQVGNFTISGGGHSFQLIGIANALQTPSMAVRAGESYCVAAQAIVDSPVSSTKLRVAFHWLDQQGALIALSTTQSRLLSVYEQVPVHSDLAVWLGAFLHELREVMDTAYRTAVIAHIYGQPVQLDRLVAEVHQIEAQLAEQIVQRLLVRDGDAHDELLDGRLATLRMCVRELSSIAVPSAYG